MEVYSNQPNIANIWQFGSHNPSPTYCLDWSKRLHTQLKDSFFKNPSLITTAKAQICEAFIYLVQGDLLFATSQIARDCIQSKKLLQIILRFKIVQITLTSFPNLGDPQRPNYMALLLEARGDKSLQENHLRPWGSWPDPGLIWLLSLYQICFPHNLFWLHLSYQEYDEEEEEPLIFICTAPSALEAAIMWQANGIALDSSWRHKNEHVAPLTFLVTLDSQMKMIPSECNYHSSWLAEVK